MQILHKKRTKDGPAQRDAAAQLLRSLQEENLIYATPYGSNDDWYWMYATVKAGKFQNSPHQAHPTLQLEIASLGGRGHKFSKPVFVQPCLKSFQSAGGFFRCCSVSNWLLIPQVFSTRCTQADISSLSTSCVCLVLDGCSCESRCSDLGNPFSMSHVSTPKFHLHLQQKKKN